MYILVHFSSQSFAHRKTLEVWNHRRPWRLGNVRPCTFFILELRVSPITLLPEHLIQKDYEAAGVVFYD